MISLLIVDDSALVRDGLSSLLRLQPDFHILDTAEDGLEAVEKVSTLNPDVVIMDAQMPNVDGMKATEKIKSSSPCVGRGHSERFRRLQGREHLCGLRWLPA